ncbi:MAG TPA: DUF2815 family protein [Candidatus Binatia bacterium]|nr:DUF2815 family protein [Candidatus Binatia bacterium]
MTVKNTDTKVITGKVRLSYCHVFNPQTDDNGEIKYSTAILIPKGDKETLKKIKAAVEAAKELGKNKWGGKIPGNLKTPLRDGDEERGDDEVYKGHYFLNASSRQKPGIVDKNLKEIIDSTELYSGCYARVSLNFYAYDAKGNRGIAAGLNNLQKVADGDYLGGRSRAEDDFEAIEDDEDDDFLG